MNREQAFDRWVEQTHLSEYQWNRPLTERSQLAETFEKHVPVTDVYSDFHRGPLAHQLRDFYRFRDRAYHALFWQQRARKTWLELNIFRHRLSLGHVNCLLVIAHPNGVHRVWIDELQKDIPPNELTRYRWLAWKSGCLDGRKGADNLTIKDHSGPIVVTFNSEAIIYPKCWRFIQQLLAKRKLMIVADEASWAANWNARTQRLLALGGWRGTQPNVIIKSILDGTPVDEGPEDIYFPTTFLQKGCLGFTSAEAFRNRYLVYAQEELSPGVYVRKKFFNRKTNSEFETVIGTQNMDELQEKMLAIGSRVLRREVSDAPPKTYQPRYFELTPIQRKVYDRARDEYSAELDGREVSLREVLLRMIRLQMIARNYYPPEKIGSPCIACQATGVDCDTCGGLGYLVSLTQLSRIDTRSPALEALESEIKTAGTPAVVWCAFKQDCRDVKQLLGARCGEYHGDIPADERERAYQDFRAGNLDYIVGTITAGLSRGKDLTRAGLLVYYSNVFSRRARSQSEDRAEGLDRKESTSIVDLVAEDTRDVEVIEALKSKRELAAAIMGDPLHML